MITAVIDDQTHELRDHFDVSPCSSLTDKEG